MAKTLTGIVVSNAMQNTVSVRVHTKERHPMYKKVVVSSKKFKAHYEGDKPEVGQTIEIVETRPISKEVHFVVRKIIKAE
jgi:small subunit ribosomal protein S17